MRGKLKLFFANAIVALKAEFVIVTESAATRD